MDLSEKIRDMDFPAIAEALARDARQCVQGIVESNRENEEFKGFASGVLTGKPRLSIVVVGDHSAPVFELSMDLASHEAKLGYYRYVADLDLNFVDEFFVVF